ncbi:MAG: PocR ligand-binding domain-containing protein [Bacteroidales bacterium]
MVETALPSGEINGSNPVSADWNQSLPGDEGGALAAVFTQLTELFEDFRSLTGLAVAVTGLDGRVLAASSWQPICMEFHRSHAATLERCRESNACLTALVGQGGSAVTTCRNGLTDCAAPVLIGGRHVATLYAGQFLTAAPDEGFFRRQQQEFGFDAESYRRALAAIPVIPSERVPGILRLLTGMAEQIASRTLNEQQVRAALADSDALVRERSRQLNENNSRLRKIAARAPGVMYQFVRTPDGRYLMPFVSEGIGAMFGVAADILATDARALFERISPEDLRGLLAAVEHSAETLEPWKHEFQVCVDGVRRWIYGNSLPERDEQGNVVWHGFLSDITERKRREALLQARVRLAEGAGRRSLHELLVATLDEACALTCSLIGFYHFIDADQQSLTLQAWSTRTTGEFCTAAAEMRHYPLHQAGIWAEAVRARRPLICNDYAAAEGRKGLPDGHAVVERMIAIPIVRDGLVKAVIGVGNKAGDYDDADVHVVGILADLAWDVAERKRAEEILAERTVLVERRYESLRALNEIAALPPSEGDPLGRALELGARHLGLPLAIVARIDGDDYEVLRHHAAAGMAIKDGQHFSLADTYCAVTLAANEVTAIAHMARSPYAGHRCYRAFGLEAYIGAPIHVGGVAFGTLGFSSPQPYPRPFDEGDCEFVSLMARWIGTVIERQQAAVAIDKAVAELARSNEELQQFAYAASHDLRQPLRMVSSYLGLIERRLGERLDDEMREFIGYAVKGAVQMDRLIVDLLDYSRVGRHADGPAEVDLADVVAEAARNLGVAAAECGGHIEVEGGPAVLHGNRTDLVRLFQNLIGNGIKYRAADRPPVVRVAWRRQGDCWQVSVADNGIGIAPQYHQEIFKIFRRLHSSRDYEGSGIGLAVCQKVVANHRGSITVESEQGEGSTFRVSLPAL